MLDLNFFVDLITHLHTERDVFRYCLSFDRSKVKLGWVYQCEETSAKRDSIRNLFSVNINSKVILIYKCRYICKCNTSYFSVLNSSSGTNQSCGSIQNNFVLSFVRLYQSSFDCYSNGTDGAVSAHVQVSACIHENNTEISFFMNWFAEESTEHIMMSSRL